MQRTAADPDPRPFDARILLAFAVFFTSGMAGLIYQVVWSRMLTLVIGVSIFAITTVICTFMAGLALGSYAISRIGDRWTDPLRAYGVIEGVIGIYAALTPWIFGAVQPVYVAAFRVLDGEGLNAFRIALSALVLLVPTTLMGGTLPLLSRAIAARDQRTARGVGHLYAINTFGAVAGCLTAGFVLLAEVGIRGSLLIAAALNLAIAAACLLAPRDPSPAAASSKPAPAPPGQDRAARFVLAVFFVSGFAALGYEILWTRALLVYLRSSTYAFSLMLAVYLLGVAAGSMATAGLAGRSRRPLLGLAACQVGVVVAVAVGLVIFPHLESLGFALVGSDRVESFGRAAALMFTQASLILLLPTFFMGAMFPFGVAAYHRASRGVGRTVGSLYAVNTVGNIAGAVLVGFVTISLIGVRHSILLMMALNLLVAAAILLRTWRLPGHRFLWPAAAVGILGIVHLTVSTQIFYQSHARLPGTRIIFYREGASDTVAVVEREKPRRARTLIFGDGRGAAGTSSLPWNLYFGHLPMLLHPNPQQILHICYGSGNSVMALTRHDPERIDVVELSPHVREASEYFWTNEGVLELPIVNLIIEDGRNFLLGTDRTYDVVSLEPPNIFSAGVVNLYTQEFYELARDHLNPGGVMVQWLPTGTLSPTDRGHLIRAFTEAFPYAYVWQQLRSPQLLLMGTLEPLSVDLDEVQRRLASAPLQRDLANMHQHDAAEYLSWFRLGDESTRALAAGYEPVRDDRTIVDYSIPYYIGSGFGFYLHTYRLGPKGYKVSALIEEKTREYMEWGDPVSLIIPDAHQAQRVGEIIARRRRIERAALAP